MKRKALSPVIATVLLIAIVIIIALIIFLWFRGLSEEIITKFGKKNIKLVCADVKFKAEYSSLTLSVSNIGNVPLYDFNLKISGSGSYITKKLKEVSGTNWPSTGLSPGE